MIPFSPPFIDQDVTDEINDTLQSGWITTGPKTKALEDYIASFSGVEKALCLNSATSGLMLAMKWFGIGPGDEVIVPVYTYCATALAVYHLGAKPVMVDITNDFLIDIEKVRQSITNRTKAIIPVDFAGYPCDYDNLLTLVNEPGVKAKFITKGKIQKSLGRILILSDAAHSIGAVYKGKKTGSHADLTVFSLHAVKNVTTAEGGAICISLPKPFETQEVYAIMRLMSLNGQTKDALTKTKAGGWRYDIVLPGYKMNMPDVCAAIGLAQIRKYDNNLLPRRKEIALRYNQGFSKCYWAEYPPLQDSVRETSYHIYPIRIKGIDEPTRDKIIDAISKAGVSVNVHFIPMPMLSFFQEQGYKIEDFPVAYYNYSREISLPIYPQLTLVDVDFIVKTVIDSVNENLKK